MIANFPLNHPTPTPEKVPQPPTHHQPTVDKPGRPFLVPRKPKAAFQWPPTCLKEFAGINQPRWVRRWCLASTKHSYGTCEASVFFSLGCLRFKAVTHSTPCAEARGRLQSSGLSLLAQLLLLKCKQGSFLPWVVVSSCRPRLWS